MPVFIHTKPELTIVLLLEHLAPFTANTKEYAYKRYKSIAKNYNLWATYFAADTRIYLLPDFWGDFKKTHDWLCIFVLIKGFMRGYVGDE